MLKCEQLKNTIFDSTHLNKDVVGQSVQKIAELAGVSIPEGTRVILLEASGIGSADILCKRKNVSCYDNFQIQDFRRCTMLLKQT